MSNLRTNLVKRVQRLPKPANVSKAMLPLFEAISNSIHSTHARYGENVSRLGKIAVTVETNRSKNGFWATVEDNGVGLTDGNWDAFTTTDTDNKIDIGGKGVGRLLWLDCFENIHVKSVFEHPEGMKIREFDFVLDNKEQIKNEKINDAADRAEPMFFVKISGLRDNGYKAKFPGRDSFVFQHLTSHFLPTFIGNKSPIVTVIVGAESKIYPTAIDDIVHRRTQEIIIDTVDYSQLRLTLMECDKVASADLQGSHFVHFIAHERNVHSHTIDGRLGLKYFGPEKTRVFHAIITGAFLDTNVNQERAGFLFDDSTFDKIINEHCIKHIEQLLAEPLAEIRGAQRKTIGQITATYSSVSFGDLDELQKKVPSGELKADAIYGHLARERFRRDERQAETIRAVLARLKSSDVKVETFFETIRQATATLEASSQRSLAEYVVRRKVVLDFLDSLLEKSRDSDSDSSYEREDILHSFICPIKINAVGSGRRVTASSSHELWIIDERLTFAEYFSSDVDFNSIAAEFESAERPDVLVFDHVHGLRQTDSPSKVLLVEFKRPGRRQYDEHSQHQIERYVRRLQGGALSDVRGRPIKLGENTIFYCFVIADIVGKLDEWTYSWQRTVDGRGRIYRPESGFKGSIELISWEALIEDARSRNAAFFDRAGISGESFFSAANPIPKLEANEEAVADQSVD